MNQRIYFRQLAIQRRRDPQQDVRNAEASERLRQRVAALLADNPVIRHMNAQAAADGNA